MAITQITHRFRFERIAEVLETVGTALDADDVLEAFPNLLEIDDSEDQVLLVPGERLELAVLQMARVSESSLEGPFDRELASWRVARHVGWDVHWRSDLLT